MKRLSVFMFIMTYFFVQQSDSKQITLPEMAKIEDSLTKPQDYLKRMMMTKMVTNALLDFQIKATENRFEVFPPTPAEKKTLENLKKLTPEILGFQDNFIKQVSPWFKKAQEFHDFYIQNTPMGQFFNTTINALIQMQPKKTS